ncbi:MAG TPA: AbrB/MazE/SpoVT family DNA-binding domain-containing protein [Chloroflexota bacterium]|nr:AbrB/MazE/SpoVT family DNA-binding domain-containing protein [Chloroflexota bacterium]
MQTHIRKWGNSLALRIPHAFAQEAQLEEGTPVELVLSDGQLVVRPLRRPYRLADLVAGITPENRHEETKAGRRGTRSRFPCRLACLSRG